MKLDFSKSEDGLIPAIAQDCQTNEVLMLAYINEEAWNLSLKTGNATYWSRSRSKLWKKGESSGNVQEIKEIYFDCDEDTVIFKVNQIGGAACHVGYKSCFYRKLDRKTNEIEIMGKPVFNPDEVYNK